MSLESLDGLSTEGLNPRTLDLDRLDTLGVLERLNAEDQQVAPAVRLVLPAVAAAVDLAFDRWQAGGRVVLFGAGTSGRLAALDAAELGPTFGVSPRRYLARMGAGRGRFSKPSKARRMTPSSAPRMPPTCRRSTSRSGSPRAGERRGSSGRWSAPADSARLRSVWPACPSRLWRRTRTC
jgi:hypothetical protein